MRADGDRKFVVALARGLEVLRAFKPNEGLLGNQEIAARTGLPKPTVSRLAYTLTRLGYLTYVVRLGKYQLAPAALALGYAALAHIGIRHVARPFMQELADAVGASVALGSRDRASVIYVEHCHSRSPVTVRLEVGSRIPIATTAVGRALLAVMPPPEREEVFARLAAREGAGWPAMRASLEQAIAEVATRGFALSIGDWYPDINAVGVPLVPADGSGVFALNCGAPAFRLSRERLVDEIGPRLLAVARNVQGVLNGSDEAWRTALQHQCNREGDQRGIGDGAADWSDAGASAPDGGPAVGP